MIAKRIYRDPTVTFAGIPSVVVYGQTRCVRQFAAIFVFFVVIVTRCSRRMPLGLKTAEGML